MRTIERVVYKFEELSDSAKERVRNRFGENHADIESDMLKYDFKDQLAEKCGYFLEPEFQWSLGCCQGDGLSFSCKIDIQGFIEEFYPSMRQSMKNIIIESCEFYNVGNRGRYCYASRSDIDVDFSNYGDKLASRSKHFNKIVNELVEHLRDVYMDICETFEKQGYKAYEYLYTEDYAKDTCDANEYEFYEDGTMY